jgi:hypothetical protein
MTLFARLREKWEWHWTIHSTYASWDKFCEALTAEKRTSYLEGYAAGRSSVLLELKRKDVQAQQKGVN